MIARFLWTVLFCSVSAVGFPILLATALNWPEKVDTSGAYYIVIYIVLGFIARCTLGSSGWAFAAIVFTGFVDGAASPTAGALAARRPPAIYEITGPWALISVLAGLVRGTILGAIGVFVASMVQKVRRRR